MALIYSVAYLQCCGSEMFIPDPDFCQSPDLGSRIQKQQQMRGMTKISCQLGQFTKN